MKVDPKRWEERELWELEGTGIYVRAQTPDGGWESVDIVYLDKDSLEGWLKELCREDLIRLVERLLQHEEV